MTGSRRRLTGLAAAAGYGPDALKLIAEAALPDYRPSNRLNDADISQVASAVEVLAQCGYREEVLPDIVNHYRDRYGEPRWRTEFWQRQLRTAALRFTHPRLYGLSPCDGDPGRLARLGHPAGDDELPGARLARAA